MVDGEFDAVSADRSPSSSTQVLTIRIDPGFRDGYPYTTLLIDGVDRIGRGELIGFDPAELLDTGALLPQDPPRRVALYRCGGCGEPGCGSAAAIIRQVGDRVVWEDFQDYVGVFVTPLHDDREDFEDGDIWGGRPLDVPDFVFDSAQYVAAVEGAAADRSWETRLRRIGRLLRERLQRDAEAWLPAGWSVGWLDPDGDAGTFRIELRKPGHQRVIAASTGLTRSDDEIVEAVATELSATSSTAWNVVSEHEWREP